MIVTNWCINIQFIDSFDTGADMSIRSAIIIASIAGLLCLAIVCIGLALQLLHCWMELDALAIQKTACKSKSLIVRSIIDMILFFNICLKFILFFF